MSVDRSVFITATGAYLPGPNIPNHEMEAYLGEICGKPSRLRERMLKQNGIKGRHYALDKNQCTTHQNAELAAYAVSDALETAGLARSDVGALIAATSQGDLPLPGFGSMVHGELGGSACEAVTHHGVCASGLAALKTGFLNVKTGAHDNAVVVASELPSRLFKASRYTEQQEVSERGRLDSDAEFLRWMLSDGAGSLVLSDQPTPKGFSFKVEWIRLKSHAHRHPACMYVGGSTREDGPLESWLDAPDYQDAAERGLINLRQDLREVEHIVKLGVADYLRLVEEGLIDPQAIDHMLCHFSSSCFLGQIHHLAEQAGAMIPRERWNQTMYEKGNTGSASLFIMLDDLAKNGELAVGQQVLCMVPESGRFTTGFMKLTVVDNSARATVATGQGVSTPAQPVGGSKPADQVALRQSLMRRLLLTWHDFEAELEEVPVVADLHQGRMTIEEYRALLRNLRAQVVQGANWISRAVSSIDPEYVDLRNTFLGHAKEEHLDYRILEQDYVNSGGTLEEITGARPNVGSEALSAFMMQRASRPNPWDLLGSMFIIEGLGQNVATRWANQLVDSLELSADQTRFLSYHGQADEAHTEKLHQAIEALDLTEMLVDRIVRTAEVTAKLYCLQLSELEV